MVVTNNQLIIDQNLCASNLQENIVTHIAVGSDNTTPDESDTSLGSETYREALYNSNVSSNIALFDARLDVTENNGNTINEVSTQDASSGGNMQTRNLTTSFTKTSSNEVFYRIKVTYTAQDNS